MDGMAPRKYEQQLRAASAAETRRRILDALYEQLRTVPTEPLSLGQVAKAAEVSRSTIYLVFGSRAGLFEALAMDVLQRGGMARMMRDAEDPDPLRALHGAVRGCVMMYAAHADVLRALAALAVVDAESVGSVLSQMEGGRATGMRELARHLADHGALRDGVTVDAATDLLWLLTSFSSFDQLHTGRNLPAEQVAETLALAAERAVSTARSQP
jgi:AcrR family transcriptional regulator